jgi:hypothetical protein
LPGTIFISSYTQIGRALLRKRDCRDGASATALPFGPMPPAD